MHLPRYALSALLLGLALLAACQDSGAPEANPTDDFQTPAPLPSAQAAYCPNGGQITVVPNEPLAAKVNGVSIPLGLYQRQVVQSQAALLAQGLDPKSNTGKDALKGMETEVLGQLIDDVLIQQAAAEEQVTVSDADVNDRIQQMINDAGSREKFDAYLQQNQIQLPDLCAQMRGAVFGDRMLARVTAALPTQAEQVHAAHILVTTPADAAKVQAELKAGKDFAALAKQYSKDEVTKNNGGDLGWFPKGVMAPEFEAAAFALQPGQVSGVVTTPLGLHIIKVLERDAARPLSTEMLQFERQQAFLAWLAARRDKAQIERLVNP